MKQIGKVPDLLWRMCYHTRLKAFCRLVRPDVVVDTVRLGSDYGGWVIVPSALAPESICYSGGVGDDTTFDRELIRRYGCSVHAFDPTPRAIEHGTALASSEVGFEFHPVGLWRSDSIERFYEPRHAGHISHSISNLAGTTEHFSAPCRTVPSLVAEMGHGDLHLLKLDIEGAAPEVLESTFEAGVKPWQICVEIDQPCPLRAALSLVSSIRSAGYFLVATDRWNCTFIRKDIADKR